MKSKAGTRAALVWLLALVGVGAAVATADATPPSANGTIAFHRYFDANQSPGAAARPMGDRRADATGHILFTRAGGAYGDETLFVARADGSGQHRISPVGVVCCPWATRSGSRIVFSANGPGGRVTAATARLDGSNRIVLSLPKGTLNLGPGPLSADGKTIAREGFDDKHPAHAGIYLTRASDGKILRRLTRTHFIPGDFSPDGKQLVLFKGPDGNPPPPGSLWIVNSNATGLRRLTPPSVQVECCFNYRWSPDGTSILFADSNGLVWTIAPNGSKLTQVFKAANGGYAATPTWSPDGSTILFALDPTPNPFDHPNNGLYVIHADGSGLTEILGGNDFKREPVWVTG
jgi:dipeptidyl aminopeptidase/acylaminoacyl peptidase